LEPNHLKTFIKNKSPLASIGEQFLQSVKNIDEIKLNKSISMFHDLNDLLIVFYNKGKLTNGDSNDSSSSKSNKTKKIYIKPTSFKKTKRNIFKESLL
jgi:hypothetical protein